MLQATCRSWLRRAPLLGASGRTLRGRETGAILSSRRSTTIASADEPSWAIPRTPMLGFCKPRASRRFLKALMLDLANALFFMSIRYARYLYTSSRISRKHTSVDYPKVTSGFSFNNEREGGKLQFKEESGACQASALTLRGTPTFTKRLLRTTLSMLSVSSAQWQYIREQHHSMDAAAERKNQRSRNT